MTPHDIRQAFDHLVQDPALPLAAMSENEWFTPAQVRTAMEAVAPWFAPGEMESVQARYTPTARPRRIGIVMAGNVPLVGLHDLLAVLLMGHVAVVKASHKDAVLVRAFVEGLPEADRVVFTDRLVPGQVDFLLATGSGNTARQLDYAYRDTPRFIRRNRFSVAILDGTETDAELQLLAQDVLTYHGMGCRSVSVVLFPSDMDPSRWCTVLDTAPVPELSPDWSRLQQWERAIATLVDTFTLSCNRILVEVRTQVSAPRPGVLHAVPYEGDAGALLAPLREELQCIVGHGHLPFGESQWPTLLDFADGVDTFALLADQVQENT